MIDSEEMGDGGHIFALGFIVLTLLVFLSVLSENGMTPHTLKQSEPAVVVERLEETADCLVKFQHKFAVTLTNGEPLKRQMTENEIKTLHSIAMYECKKMEENK